MHMATLEKIPVLPVVHGGIRPKAIEIQENNKLQVECYDCLKWNTVQIYVFKAFIFPFFFQLSQHIFLIAMMISLKIIISELLKKMQLVNIVVNIS